MRSIRRKRSRSFFHYLTSYLFIFLIPVLILSSLICSWLLGYFKDSCTEENLAALDRIKATTDKGIDEIHRITSAVSTNPSLSPFVIDESAYNRCEAVLELRGYVEANSFIDDIVLYIRNQDVLYTQDKLYNFDEFYKYKYCDSTWEKEQFIENINNIGKGRFRVMKTAMGTSAESGGEFIAYYQPCPQFGAYATLIFLTDIAKRHVEISSIVQSDNVAEFILSNDGNILLPCDNEEINDFLLQNKHRIITDKNGKNSNYFVARIGDEKYVISYANSDIIDLTYVTIVPFKDVMADYYHVLGFTGDVILIVFFFGILSIFYMMKKTYKPLYMMRKNLDNLLDAPVATDDIDVIRSVIFNIEDKNKALEKKMDRYQTFLSDSVVYSLLNGISVYSNNMSDILTETSIMLDLKYFVVVTMGSTEDMSAVKDIIDDNYNVLSRNINVYSTCHYEESINYVILLFNFENADDYDLICKYCLQLVSDEIKEFNIGVGNYYEGYENIARSYIESRSAYEYSIFKGKANMGLINDIGEMEQFYYPVDELAELINNIKYGDISNAKNSLNCIFKALRQDNCPKYIIKCYCLDLVNSLLKAMLDLNIDIELLHNNKIDIFNLTHFTDIQQLESQLEDVCIVICSYINDSLRGSNDVLKSEIIEYVQNNFRDSNFSLKMMALHFGLNMSYLSRFFKKHMNETLTEYVTKLRMAEVKYKMETTDKSIRDIVYEVGYIDVPSFCRKFKQCEGMSPSEYRKVVRKD